MTHRAALLVVEHHGLVAVPHRLAVGKSVKLDEIAAGDGRLLGIGDLLRLHGYTALGDLGLVGDHIVAEILAVEHYVDKAYRRRVLHAHKRTYLKGDGIAHERLVGIVGQKHPALGLGREVEEIDLAVKFHTIRLLGHIPGGVATAAHTHRQGVAALGRVGAHHRERALDIIALARDRGRAFSVDIDGRNLGKALSGVGRQHAQHGHEQRQ